MLPAQLYQRALDLLSMQSVLAVLWHIHPMVCRHVALCSHEGAGLEAGYHRCKILCLPRAAKSHARLQQQCHLPKASWSGRWGVWIESRESFLAGCCLSPLSLYLSKAQVKRERKGLERKQHKAASGGSSTVWTTQVSLGASPRSMLPSTNQWNNWTKKHLSLVFRILAPTGCSRRRKSNSAAASHSFIHPVMILFLFGNHSKRHI